MSAETAQTELTVDDVVYAYRLFLDRYPENDLVIADHIRSSRTRRRLRDVFMRSEEFISKNTEVIASGPAPDRLSNPMRIDYAATDEQAALMIERTLATWRRLGAERPHWSVLSVDDYLPDRPENEERFFESGEGDADLVLSILKFIGRSSGDFASINEYGCGLGRTTNPLARRFKSVIAHDISPTHLAFARARSESLGLRNIRYVHCEDACFGMHEPIDLWFSAIVLQHNPPPIIAMIVERALSLLRPGGVAIFQVPTHAPGYRFSMDEYLRGEAGPSFEMHPIEQRMVFEIAARTGCRLLSVLEDYQCGGDWLSNMFIIERAASA